MKRRLMAILLVLSVCISSLSHGITAFAQGNEGSGQQELLRLWYTEPAPVNTNSYQWQSTILPIGNGYMGGMVFGGISRERVHFNEKSMWTGGPAPNRPNYNGANRVSQVTMEEINSYREKLDDKSSQVFGMTKSASDTQLINIIRGGENQWSGMGMYQDFGDIYLDFARSGISDAAVTGYVRDLDMNTAVASVGYNFEGTTYRREYFNSYPDNVLVMQLTADGAGKLTFDASIAPYTSGTTNRNTVAQGDLITYTGQLSDNALQFEAQFKVLSQGGSQTANENGTISVTGADQVTLILACGTDYENVYPDYRGEHPHEAVTARIAAAAEMGYDQLLERHLADYKELFSRVSLDLDAQTPAIPTDQLVANYQGGDYNRALEVMAFQYGRYLTIAGSREGTLPTNLNGVWMIGSASQFWNADYHFNVNFQMNYWPTLSTNLAECATSLNDYIESLRVPGRVTAGASAGVPSGEGEENGFLVHTVNNIFGVTAPYHVQEFGWNIGGSSWILQNVYDYYRFTGDEAYLQEKIYPMLKEMAGFWTEFLWYSPYQDRMVVSPSVSAEQGPTVNGSTYDQSLVWQLFEEAIQAAEILDVDADERETWRALQEQLNPILIGDEGQIKEWYEETTIGRAKAADLAEIAIPNFNAGYAGPHRHISHLVGLYPGTLINRENEEVLEAARYTLLEKGFEATGWSKAHKINAWARTYDAENTYKLVRSMLGANYAGIMGNLLGSHGQGTNHRDTPVFQIEANYGLTAGISEMLLQSHLGYTHFLPTIPQEWSKGSVTGLVSRGNFVVDMDWENGAANYFRVTSRNGGGFTGEYMGIANAKITDSSGEVVEGAADGRDRISFETVPGETYTITLNEAGNFRLSTDAHHVKADEYANITTGFVEPVSSNTAILNYTFDTEHFEYADFHPAGGVQVVSKEATSQGAKVVVMISDYNTRDYGQLAIHAKTNAALTNGWAVVMADVEYVVKDENGNKEIQAAVASAAFTTRGNGPDPFVDGDTNGDGVVDLIDLSNMIDWFGIGNNHPQWNDFYVFFDDNNNGEIDIYDIVYVARLIS